MEDHKDASVGKNNSALVFKADIVADTGSQKHLVMYNFKVLAACSDISAWTTDRRPFTFNHQTHFLYFLMILRESRSKFVFKNDIVMMMVFTFRAIN